MRAPAATATSIANNNDHLCALFDQAVNNGDLIFRHSTTILCREEDGQEYKIIYCPTLSAKRAAGVVKAPKANPFLPYEKELFICNILSSHVLLFNKYSLIRPHVLLITSEYQEQDSNLTRADFWAVERFYELYGDDYIMFYNCGPCSGASQPHRHFQFVPNWKGSEPVVGTVIPCQAKDLFSAFQRLPKSDSFNLLFSPSWGLCIVHRTQEHCSLGMSLNSLACLGCILVRCERDVKRCQQVGAKALLQQVVMAATEQHHSTLINE